MPADTLDTIKYLSSLNNDLIVAMQAAWIEWRHGQGADAGMQWIENTLIGPGLIPHDEPYCQEAQSFFSANKSDPMPLCQACGNPSTISGAKGSFCNWQHEREYNANK